MAWYVMSDYKTRRCAGFWHTALGYLVVKQGYLITTFSVLLPVTLM